MRYLKLFVVLALLSATMAFAGGASAQEDDGAPPTPRELGAERGAQVPLPTPPLETTATDLLPATTPGAEALEILSPADLAAVATQNGQSVAQMTETLANDPAVYVDARGTLLFVDEFVYTGEGTQEAPAAGPFPNAQTFQLHSSPGSSRVIYLDFDGYNLPAGTSWNGGQALVAPPWDTDGNGGTWSQSEHDTIQSVWQRVAEDYAVFDVDVTTEDPGYAAINRSSPTDVNFGTRVVITDMAGIDDCTYGPTGGCGGVAWIGVFDSVGSTHDYYQPAWAFPGNPAFGDSAKGITAIVSHEAGHNIGLNHDGQGGDAYYLGHDPWAPIMGVEVGQPVSQWSQGGYTGATNTEDDFAVAASNGLPLRADDADCFVTTTDVVNVGAVQMLNPGGDCDTFRYVAPCSGTYDIYVAPDPGVSPNVSLYVDIYEYNPLVYLTGTGVQPVRVNNDLASGMGELLTIDLTGGVEYLLAVFPLANGTPLAPAPTGWDNYGNVGQYEIVPFTPGGCTPNNDQFLLADTIGGPSDTQTGSNVGYTNEPGEPDPTCDFGSPLGPSAWWNWTAPSTGRVNMDTVGSSFDTVMAVYTGGSVGSLTEVACNDQNGLNSTSEVSFNASAGTTYRIQVYGYFGQTGNIVLNTRPAPFIRPFGTVVAEGDTGSQIANLIVYLEDAAGNPYASPTPVSVNWATVDIPSNPLVAHPGSDYIANSGVLTFAPGQTQATVPVEVLGDTVVEPPLLYGEWGLASFTGASSNAIIKQNFFGLALLIIVDDD